MKPEEVEIFEIKDKSLAARIGELITAHGKITTPTLFPVINPLYQEVSLETIKNIGYEAIITNAYILKKHREQEVSKEGIHKYLNFNGPIMTDSGGYQILEYGDVEVEPHEIVKFQERIGSDIAVILDVPTGGQASYDEAKWTVEETLRRARLSLKYIKEEKTIWVLPIQGGKYLDLLEYCAKKALEMPQYKMISIGSPTQILEKYDYQTLVKMIITVKNIIPPKYPVHLFGAGHPMFFPFAVALGIDTFDSASYILYAKDERIILPHGTLRLREIKEIPCTCPVCSKYTVQELLSLRRDERIKLLATHNLYIIWQEIKKIREAIRENTLWDLLEERRHSHPALLKAFKELVKYSKYIEKYHPLPKPEISGIFLYDKLSLHRPEILRHRRNIVSKYKPPTAFKVALVLFDIEAKPITRTNFYREIREKVSIEDVHILVFMPYFGIVPEELAETFPLSQHEKDYDEAVLANSLRVVYDYFLYHRDSYKKVVLAVKYPTLEVKNLAEKLSSEGLKTHVLRYSEENVEDLVNEVLKFL